MAIKKNAPGSTEYTYGGDWKARGLDAQPMPQQTVSAWRCADPECGKLTLERPDGTRSPQCGHCGGTDFCADLPVQVALPVPEGYILRKCTGEAHSNAYIDYCSACMRPNTWGWILQRMVGVKEVL